MVLLLAVMVVMVFGNVVLRYLFDTGIDVSEELSRFFFVWLTFIGAVVVGRENAHLGVETLVSRLGDTGRKVCMVLSDLFIIGCCIVFSGERGSRQRSTRPTTLRSQKSRCSGSTASDFSPASDWGSWRPCGFCGW